MRHRAYSRLFSLHSPKSQSLVVIFASLLLLLGPTKAGFAQIYPAWSNIDMVTSGPCDDFHPVIPHNMFGYSYGRTPMLAVFERWTASESQIASVKFDPSTIKWDSSIQVISTVPQAEAQVKPDYAEIMTTSGLLRIAVWQRKENEAWRIYYSTLRDSPSVWSTAALLVNDSLENPTVRVCPFNNYGYDSTFLLTWKSGKAIKALLWSPGKVTQLDTMGLGETDSLEYDVAAFWGALHLVWTSGSAQRPMLQYKRLDSFGFPNQTKQETLLTNMAVGNPRIVIAPYGPPILVESRSSSKTDILFSLQLYSNSPTFQSFTNDTSAENRNANAFDIPVVTKRADSPAWPPHFDASVYEKYRGSDSMLVFGSDGLSDTVRSSGHNSNPVVGSQTLATKSPFEIPFIWESNRTGRSHLYSRRVAPYIWSVDEHPAAPASYVLYQNYPNPFNPKTGVRFQVPALSGVEGPSGEGAGVGGQGSGVSVKLAVYDILGRELDVLVDERKMPGSYEVIFDGSRLASGVYYYRLRAGSFVQSRKMLLLK